MPRQRRRNRGPYRQLDLCLASPPAAPDAAPGWSTLPDPTQQALTSLLTRLLIAHAGGTAPELGAHPEGDADER